MISLRKVWLITAVAFAFTLPKMVNAADAAAGEQKAAVCAACHGPQGIAVLPMYPNLAGQNEQYLVTSMQAYKDGSRSGGLAEVMKVQMSQLEASDMADLAAYYSSLK